ncbi:MAG: hypothetical protein JEZ09_04055 [Salinivirgaceae bacterium]|nr:hypothetical protein [Salinivirgaceae bacterium]
MKELEKLSLIELKSYKELIENRMNQLRRHQIDGEYYPPYTEKEIKQVKEKEEKAAKALLTVNKLIRLKLDEFIDGLKI